MPQKIGDFLVSIGAINELQVEEVIAIQRDEEEPRMFGEIAISLGYINDEALRRYIEHKDAREKE
jgi:hypothetical protein